MRRPALSRGVAALVVVGALAAAPSSGGAAGRCQGEPVTGDRGTRGDDVLVVEDGGSKDAGRGDDLVCTVGPGGFHEVYGGAGDDRIFGGEGMDYIYPGEGDDTIATGAGKDLVSDFEDEGDDVFAGGPGEDWLRFSAMFRRLTVEPVSVDMRAGRATGHGHDGLGGFEILEGTGKPDRLLGSVRGEEIIAVRGGDRVAGRGGDDLIFGAAIAFSEEGERDPYDGRDPWLRGGPGNDRIYGLLGADRLSGGPGADLLDGGGPLPDQPGLGDTGNGGDGADECRELERATFCER